jgi:hypothetical protein
MRIPFERVAQFETRLPGGGQKETVVSRAELDVDRQVYIANTSSQRDANLSESAHWVVGAPFLKNHEILNLTLPEARSDDPMIKRRMLAVLAFSTLRANAYMGSGATDAHLFISPKERSGELEDIYGEVLGLRRRSEGYITGERDKDLVLSATLRKAFGRAADILTQAETYAAPLQDEYKEIEWSNNERTA